MKKEMHSKLSSNIEKNISGYIESEDVKEYFLERLAKSKNIKAELYYLEEAQKKVITQKATLYEKTKDLCKTWLPLIMCFSDLNLSAGCLGGTFAAANIYYQKQLQKQKLKIESLQETIDIMGKIIKQFHEKEDELNHNDHSNPNLNQMNWSTNAMTRKEGDNQEINI